MGYNGPMMQQLSQVLSVRSENEHLPFLKVVDLFSRVLNSQKALQKLMLAKQAKLCNGFLAKLWQIRP
jgi:hypothetical protein